MADMIPQGTQEGDAEALGGHERADANIRAVVMTMVVILSSCTIVVALLIPMFSAFTAREERKDRSTPDIFTVRQIPPEPRLLPIPIDDTDQRLTLGLPSTAGPRATSSGKSPEGQQNSDAQPRESINYTTDNQLPWDKMLSEAAIEEAQYASYTRDPKTGRVTIPVERAMELMVGPAAKKTGAGAQPGATTPAGAHDDKAHSTAGQQTGEMAAGVTRDMPAYYGPVITENGQWEQSWEKYTADSSGGLKFSRPENRR
jgi:hypothetical protein